MPKATLPATTSKESLYFSDKLWSCTSHLEWMAPLSVE